MTIYVTRQLLLVDGEKTAGLLSSMRKATFRVAAALAALVMATGLAETAQAAPLPATVQAASTRFDHVRDFDGDGNADVLARDSFGTLWLYPGNGYGGFLARKRISGGWSHMTAIITGHFIRSGHNDIVARGYDGNLWLYAGNGNGTFKPRVKIGSGWNAFTTIQNYVSTAHGTGILVRDKSGVLWDYRFNTATRHFSPKKLAGGFGQYTKVLWVDDWSNDGNPGDVVAIDKSGKFWLYAEDPYGAFYPRRQISPTGPPYTAVISPEDWDGSGAPNLMGRDSRGVLYVLSPITPAPHRVSHGWNGFDLF
jgi:hypothetical protein